MNEVNEKELCCGCMACKSICPHNAMSIVTDEKGFLYPYIDWRKCMECGVCKVICEFNKEKLTDTTIKKAYSFRVDDSDVLYNSTSGGAFTAISDIVLENKGIVVGAVMDNDFEVYHLVADNKILRDLMRKSKYVQSNTDGIFSVVKKYVESKIFVLFVGTPCQVAQLNNYIGENREYLLTCDFICHGVPNNRFLKEHIRFLEKEYGKRAIRYIFRGKKYGWNHMMEEIVFEDGSIKSSKKVQAYSKFFYSNLSLRPSCYNCKYRTLHRYSDITIADFWGIEKIIGETDNKGNSLIFVNTEKGYVYIEGIKKVGVVTEVAIERVKGKLTEELKNCNADKENFWNTYLTKGYSALVEKYTDCSVKANVFHEIKKIIKRLLNQW